MAGSSNAGRGGGGRGGRGKFGKKSRGGRGGDNSQGSSGQSKKYTLFTTLESTVDQQVTSYKTIFDKAILFLNSQTMEYRNDLVDSLEAGKDVTITAPTLQVSTSADATTKQHENDGFRDVYRDAMSKHADRQRHLVENKRLAYGILYDKYCDKHMQEKLMNREDFDSTIKNDPHKLLSVVKELMHSTSQEKLVSPYEALWSLTVGLYQVKQGKEETLVDYYNRFKNLSSMVKRYMGTDQFKVFVQNTQEYKDETDATKKTELEKQGFERYMAMGFLMNADKDRYKTLLKSYKADFAKGNDYFPQSLTAVRENMALHFKDTKNPKKKNGQDNKSNENKTSNDSSGDKVTSFAQLAKGKQFCYCCGSPDHKADKCPEKDTRAKGNWFKTRMESHYNEARTTTPSSGSGDTVTSDPVNRDRPVGWSGLQIGVSFGQSSGMQHGSKGTIILDNGSTMSIFCDKDLVENVKTAEVPIEIATNAGKRTVIRKGNVPGYGDVWFDKNAIANIFSLSELSKKHRVTFDSAAEQAFIVHKPEGKVKFVQNDQGLYVFKVPKAYTDQVGRKKTSHLIDTVKENRHGYSSRQFKRAVLARELYHVLGAPSPEKFRQILRSNMVRNLPVVPEDVKIAETIFGPDMATLKGKSTRVTPKPVIMDIVEVPPEIRKTHYEVDLCVDLMFINSIGFMATIDRTIRYRSVVTIDSKETSDLAVSLLKVIRKYNRAGISVRMVYCDREFKPLLDGAFDRGKVTLNFSNTGDHVPEAERNIRFLKEGFRTAFHLLPYKAIPSIMIRYLAVLVAQRANYFPVKGGVSSYYSPRQLVDMKPLDYERHCRYPFGSYVQCNADTTNTPRARTRDAIYLRPSTSLQGGHEVMALDTGKLLSVSRVIKLPATDLVIKAVEGLAHSQGFTNLKFFDRSGTRLLAAHWLAGVDYPPNAVDGNNEHGNDEDDDGNDDDDDGADDDNGNVGPFEPDNDRDESNPTAHPAAPAAPAQAETSSDTDDNVNPVDPDSETETGTEVEAQVASDQGDSDDVDAVMNDDFDDGFPVDDEQDSESGEEENTEEVPDEGASTSSSVDEHEDPSNDDDEVDDDESEYGEEGEDLADRSGDEPRRSGRAAQRPERLTISKTSGKSYIAVKKDQKMSFSELCCHHNIVTQAGFTDKGQVLEYSSTDGFVLAQTMVHLNEMAMKQGASFGQQYMLQKGLKVFQDKGFEASLSEIKQQHDRGCFSPVSVSKMTPSERRKAQEALMFLTEKRDGRIKGRMVYNGKPTREWLSREDAMSPTATLEALFITAVIDAHEGRDVMTADVPNAFIQAKMPEVKDGEERVIMKITGVLVDMLVQLDPTLYKAHVVLEKNRKVVYVQVLRAIYGMLQASLLWYKKFRADLEGIGFIFNAYDPCVANRTKNGAQHTVRFHVDDLMSSHERAEVNTKFGEWLEAMYGEYKAVKPTRGKVHEYLGMTFDFSEKGVATIDMCSYVKGMLSDFAIPITKKASTPAGEKLLDSGQGKLLTGERQEAFHGTVAKGLFLCKRARPDIQPTIAVLSTRVKNPNESDWGKLVRMMEYLHGTSEKKLRLGAENLRVVKWYVDASFAVHPDFRSHTGAAMTFGQGAVQGISKKQKLNTRSSTEAELVGADDAATMILWTVAFMDEQGYTLEKNILFQDNKSAILLETNGRRSAGKRNRALNVRYFFLTDQVNKGNLSIEYCPTDLMWGDFFTKPLQGAKFKLFRKWILGE